MRRQGFGANRLLDTTNCGRARAMPIKGLTDIRRFTRGGKIRLGYKTENQKGDEYPKKSDHFIPDFPDERLLEQWTATYGEKPTRITVAFAQNALDDIFPQFYKCYGSAAGLKCKGDGETAGRYTDEGMVEVECRGPNDCDFAMSNGSSGRPGCKRLASLQVFVKGLNTMQVIQIDTTSRNSIININSGIALLQEIRRGQGIAGVWVDLVLEKQEPQVDGRKVTIYVMKIEIGMGLDKAVQLTSALDVAGALPAPDEGRDSYLYPGEVAENDPAPIPNGTTIDPDTGEIQDPPDNADTPEPSNGGHETGPAGQGNGGNGRGQRSNAATELIAAHKQTVAKALKTMGYALDLLVPALEQDYKVDAFNKLNYEQAGLVSGDIAQKQTVFEVIAENIRKARTGKTDVDIREYYEPAREALERKAEGLSGNPFMAKLSTWGTWAVDIEAEEKAAAADLADF